ncbi:MAG: FAD:protein FMN transferase [Chloroflexota bacterium]
MQHFSTQFKAMGTTVRVWSAIPDHRNLSVLEAVPLWFAKWEGIFSRFLPGSELNYLNDHAGHWVQVSTEMLTVIGAAIEASRLTGGLFNPLILPSLKAAGYDHSFSSDSFTPGEGIIQPEVPDWRELAIDIPYRCVYVPADARLDLGGIVKGWAAQEAALYLSSVGACMVDAGGDIAAYGSPDELGGWLVSLPDAETIGSGNKNANAMGNLPRILLVNAMIATSGTTFHRWQRAGQNLHHLIDPRTGQPSTSEVLMATVVSPQATLAEAWAKATLIGADLPTLPARIIYRNGVSRCNTAFERLVA